MKSILRFLLPALLLFSGFTTGWAQNEQKKLQEITERSEVVVEGEVFAQECFRNASGTNIRTANFVKTKTSIKGMPADTVVIYTDGGQVDGIGQSVSHAAKLWKGYEGIFLLRSGKETGFQGYPAYELTEDNLGLVQRCLKDRDKEGYYAGTRTPFDSWREVRERIGSWCGMDLTIHPIGPGTQGTLNSTELCVKIANAIPLIQTQQIQFDIFVKSSQAGLLFEAIDLYIDYPTQHIEQNVVANGGITATKQTVAAASLYQLSLQDVTNSRLRMSITGNCAASMLSRYALSTEYERLARVVVDVSDWGDIGALSLQNFTINGSAKYYISADRCYNFERLCAEGAVHFSPCEVTNVTVAPFAAGIGEVMTITGANFGNGFLGEITIPNPNDGGATDFDIFGGPLIQPWYFESWTDTEIKIKVSSLGPGDHPFGSGIWTIDPDKNASDPNTLACFIKVEIDYALQNQRVGQEDRMVGIARQKIFYPNGKYEWYIDAAVATNPVLQAQGITLAMVEQVAKQAYCDWETLIGINTKYMGTTNISNDRNVLSFGILSANELAKTSVYFPPTPICFDDLYFSTTINGADIKMNIDKQWFVSLNTMGIQTTQFDFYSVLMHEIGHSFGHEHAMDANDITDTDDLHLMYYKIQSKQIKRAIDGGAENGLKLLKDRTVYSIQTPDQCFYDNYTLDTSIEDCSIGTETVFASPPCTVQVKNLVASGDDIVLNTVNSKIDGVLLYNTFGQLLYNSNAWSEEALTISTTGLPAGTYFLQYLCKGVPQIEKIVVQ